MGTVNNQRRKFQNEAMAGCHDYFGNAWPDVGTSTEVLVEKKMSCQRSEKSEMCQVLRDLCGHNSVAIWMNKHCYFTCLCAKESSHSKIIKPLTPPNSKAPVTPVTGRTTDTDTITTGTFKDPRDGQVYATTTIGSQTWMVENLRYSVPGGSWDYNDDESITMGAEGSLPYGKLYSWEAVEEAVPQGWHLPTDQEWKVLESELGMPDSDLDKIGYSEKRGTDQGVQLQAGGSSGLNFLPAGFRAGNGEYQGLGLPPFKDCDNNCRTYLWVNTTTENGAVFRRRLDAKISQKSFVYRFTNPPGGYAISIRLVKDTVDNTRWEGADDDHGDYADNKSGTGRYWFGRKRRIVAKSKRGNRRKNAYKRKNLEKGHHGKMGNLTSGVGENKI